MQTLKLRPARSNDAAIRALEETVGKEQAGKILRKIEKFQRSLENRRATYKEVTAYEIKNEEYLSALCLTGCAEGDYIRKVCNWICDNRDLFGETILDIGCDTGLITCFIARQFPNSRILAVDRCENGIAVARKLAEQLGVTNVEFRQAELRTVQGTFDTVVSGRMLQENFKPDRYVDHTRLFVQMAREYSAMAEDYADVVTTLLAEQGKLISIEEAKLNPLYLGWLWALADHGVTPDYESCEELSTTYYGDIVTYQVCVCQRSGDKPDRDDIYNLFCRLTEDKCEGKEIPDDGWGANLALQNHLEDLVAGCLFAYPASTEGDCIQLSLWTMKNNPEKLLFAFHDTLEEGIDVKIWDRNEQVIREFKEQMNELENYYRCRFGLEAYDGMGVKSKMHFRYPITIKYGQGSRAASPASIHLLPRLQ